MSVAELAERTGLGINTIRRAEATNGSVRSNAANIKLIMTTFESAGVLFIPADDQGPGVRLKTAEPLPMHNRRRDAAD